jgi:ubiquinone/menaquinone biosynthesis C-methylase UbiE
MPITSESMRVVYSSYLLLYLSGEQRRQALREIARVLSPGGVALLHEEDYTRILKESESQRILGQQLGVEVSVHERPKDKYGFDKFLEKYVLVFRKPQEAPQE